MEVKGRSKVSELLKCEKIVQQRWSKEKLFERDAPEDKKRGKFFACFPFPYMNGFLHLGHAFSLSKCEFAVRYQCLRGKEVLFPFGLHCTGMPIKASADKLKAEISEFGLPPKFPDVADDTPPVSSTAPEEVVIEDKSKSKKSKAAAKTGLLRYQWTIMESLGFKEDEIAAFSDPEHWIDYFPAVTIEHLKHVGVAVDWRRSFITTDRNPYFDSFVRWQFYRLRDSKKIDFGKRYTIFCPKDGQPCLDHDRSSGEGAGPKEYTLIKIRVQQPYASKFASAFGQKAVFLVAATLRPETMYGQTNCWLGPDIDYVAILVHADKEIFICTERAARNMAYQGFTSTDGRYDVVARLKGRDMLGWALSAPLTSYSTVYALPMLTVKSDIGTGVVTSVPSDSPDDYQALKDLKMKAPLRQKYGIQDNMVLPFEPIPIIDVPEFGKLAAPTACENAKVQSQNDTEALNVIKEQLYLKGFYAGVLLVGDYAGKKIQDVKKNIQREIVEQGHGCMYYEPERRVISRSGDDCVVALCDQWYLNYGDENWKADARKALDKLNTYNESVKHNLRATVEWLHEHACCRSFGLGTKLPWDPQYLIESLSDSTIYMAYYTVAHLLHGGSVDGREMGPIKIKAEEMKPEIWDYIFLGNVAYDKLKTSVPKAKLDLLRREFLYWYPVDLRVSGKDLIQNHLSYYLFNHVAIWPKDPSKWPVSIWANGHLLLNNEKMSKSTGNFLTMVEAVEKYSADGMRLALADAGDTIEDANFMETMANAGVLRLFNFLQWVREIVLTLDRMNSQPDVSFPARVFANEINRCIELTTQLYDAMQYKEVVKTAFFQFQAARDRYREWTLQPLDHDLIFRFIEVQVLLLAPICPHLSETIWALLGHVIRTESIFKSQWPVAGAVDESLVKQCEYMEDAIHEFRVRQKAFQSAKKKGQKTAERPTHAILYVCDKYPKWQEIVLQTLQQYHVTTGSLPDNKQLSQTLLKNDELKSYGKKLMPFVAIVKENYADKGAAAFRLQSDVDEMGLLLENLDYLTSALELEEVTVKRSSEGNEKIREECRPGRPYVIFESKKPFIVSFVNRDLANGLFEVNLPIFNGDTVGSVIQRLKKIHKWRKGLDSIELYRYQDPVVGLRKIPSAVDPLAGLVLLTTEASFEVDEKSAVVIECGNPSPIGVQMIYRVCNANVCNGI